MSLQLVGVKEDLLGAGELWIDHKKDIFFPHSSTATSTNYPLEADQRVLAEGTLASTLGHLSGVSVQTWTPILTPASSDMDVNFSDLHVLQSQKIREQGIATIGGCPPTALRLSNRYGEWVRGSH
ncbi:hypothetical protein Taro_023970 [Colocasia esculenta]|uniref:Uncharacterized protein n=1 Tax=Colocasia esculenta TaxID=4460 RepID=A0A843V559_COLES|nr:hypothetical protein [Colocasia esculenta]